MPCTTNYFPNTYYFAPNIDALTLLRCQHYRDANRAKQTLREWFRLHRRPSAERLITAAGIDKNLDAYFQFKPYAYQPAHLLSLMSASNGRPCGR